MPNVEIAMGSADRIRIECLTPRMARIRVPRNGCLPEGTGLNRYGFIVPPDGPEFPVTETATGIATDAMSIAVTDGILRVQDASGQTVLEQVGQEFLPAGSVVRFQAGDDEDWVGFGDQTRDRLFHRGHVADCHVRNVKSYIPVPFFMSTRGVGVLVNTTHRIVFDMCAEDPDHFEWRDGRGTVDYYVFVAPTFGEILDLYTSLTGRPKLPPEWSFGLWYICRTQANDREAVDDAVNFRREGIPCDVIGLEPGWMERNYDGTTTKRWSPERFPIPSYAQKGPHNFFNAIKRMGYRMELWLCCDYDLSYEAERRIGQETGPERAEENSGFFQHDAELDTHFSHPKYLDTVTKRNEGWFEHLKPFVDQCADFFKQDGAYQVLDHPDRRWGNGMSDEEMHNLYPLLYARQMLEGFEEHTGRRGLTFTPCGWVGFQAWAGTWTGDTGGGEKTLGAMLNTALAGHSWATNDMEVTRKEAIHFGYLLPWAQINSWNYFRMPWMQGEELLDCHRFYSRLRARLVPYIYSQAWVATQTGRPLIAPLALDFQTDPNVRDIVFQYLLGRDLMVCAFEKDVYFPAGRWKDVWTGEVVEGGTHRTISWPGTHGGGLYFREGGIVPLGPMMQYRGEKPLDEIELHVFAATTPSSFVFYEDDGVSLAHRDGVCATTEIQAVRAEGTIRVTVGERLGTYVGDGPARRWSLAVDLDTPPKAVSGDGQPLGEDEWSFDARRGELLVAPMPGPLTLEVSL
jgi:alpha-glucosidase (family GH31 glycosyl hydrolase)